jgi:RNA polymerase sigma-70 factor (ECF subfamily)
MLQRVEAEFDREILDAATVRVRLRVDPRTWEVFRLMALEDQSGRAVAERLGLRVTAVYKARFRVQALLQEEVARLQQSDPPSGRELS